jgi:hypothetical protein
VSIEEELAELSLVVADLKEWNDDLRELLTDYQALLANIQVHCPIGMHRIIKADALHDRAKKLGIEEKHVEERNT